MTIKSTHRALGHSLVRLLVHSHRSLTCLLRTARFILLPSLARCCVHSFARSLTHSLPSSWDNGIFLSNFQCVLNHSGMTMKSTHKVLGHSLVRSLIRLHRSLIRLLRSARSARALCCALLRSFVRSLARSFTRSLAHGKEDFAYELNGSISCSFNPLGVSASVFASLCACVCVCMCLHSTLYLSHRSEMSDFANSKKNG